MRRPSRPVLAVASLLLSLCSALAVQVAAAGPAHAASCYNTTCTGKDPQVQGCAADSTTAWSAFWYTETVGVYFRRSATCQAAWARLVDDRNPAGACDVKYAIRVQSRKYDQILDRYVVVSSQVLKEPLTGADACGHTWWTKMVASSNTQEKVDVGTQYVDGIHWDGASSGWR